MNLAPRILMGCVLTAMAFGQRGPDAPHASLEWDAAFLDRSGAHPVHFVATYVDGHGQTHRLEEWRIGLSHLRRRTDDRIDLHADAVATVQPGQAMEYTWHIFDLDKKIEHQISAQGMTRAGMLYSYYSMAHVLSRPAGSFTVTEVQGLAPATRNGQHCRWFEIAAAGQPSTRVCWLSEAGIPLRMDSQAGSGWKTNFTVTTLDAKPIPPATFNADARGFQVRNLDELEDED